MPTIYNPGAGNDACVLKFAGQESRIFTQYTVRKSILQQPSQFTVRLGHGEIGPKSLKTVQQLIQTVPPNTPFELYINNNLQQTGQTDGFEANGFATELEIFGRDNIKQIHDAYLTADIAFENDTYLGLTQKVLDILNIKERISPSDLANLQITTGVGIQHYVNPATIDEVEDITPDVPAATNKIIKRSITAKLAETYFHFLQRQYRRAGIFLWAAGDGSFILSEPNSDQDPTWRLVRQRGQVRNAVNIIGHRFRNDISHRYTSAHVFGRSQGRKHGRAKALGKFVDDEMFNLLGGDFRPIGFRDVNVSTISQAEFYCRRKLAEFNRAAFYLEYTVPGHTAPVLQSGLMGTWQPNTMVQIQDDELGIKGNYYLEQVTFSRPPTVTTLTLMNPAHLIFASDEED